MGASLHSLAVRPILAPAADGTRFPAVGGSHGRGPTEGGALAVAPARGPTRADRGRVPGAGHGSAIPPLPASGPRPETDEDPGDGPLPASAPTAADQAVANQERDLASGEENAS